MVVRTSKLALNTKWLHPSSEGSGITYHKYLRIYLFNYLALLSSLLLVSLQKYNLKPCYHAMPTAYLTHDEFNATPPSIKELVLAILNCEEVERVKDITISECSADFWAATFERFLLFSTATISLIHQTLFRPLHLLAHLGQFHHAVHGPY